MTVSVTLTLCLIKGLTLGLLSLGSALEGVGPSFPFFVLKVPVWGWGLPSKCRVHSSRWTR